MAQKLNGEKVATESIQLMLMNFLLLAKWFPQQGVYYKKNSI